jgi:putative peptidoglycan lipid II flippase
MFSVAIATVLFPTLSRLAARRDFNRLGATMANGIRQIFLLLIPAAAITIALAEPITHLIYQRGNFNQHSTDQVSLALFWFSFSLPFAGANLLLTRTFFSLQRPWVPTVLAGLNLALNAAISVALYKPFGIAGLVIGTAVASAGMTFAQAWALRRDLGADLQARKTVNSVVLMLVAAAALGGVAYGTWWGLDDVLGESLPAQIVSVGFGIVAGSLVYSGLVLLFRIPEAAQIQRFVTGRLRRG